MQDFNDLLPRQLQQLLSTLTAAQRERLTELRLRANAPVYAKCGQTGGFLGRQGLTDCPREAPLLSHEELQRYFLCLCDDSVQLVEESLKQGFFSLRGGHRVGVFGQVTLRNGAITGFSSISSLVVRVAHAVEGIASPIICRCFAEGLSSVLLFGLPASGKTTCLRDLTKQLAARCVQVAVMDERGELCGTEPYTFAVGDTVDRYTFCPKAKGMELALRAGAPDLLVCDEIGGADDLVLLESVCQSGVAVCCSAHAASFEQLCRRPILQTLVEHRLFDYYAALQGGEVAAMYDREGRVLP